MSRQLPYATIREIFARFHAAEPEPKGELEHVNAYTLLVAVALSAQATDAGVNRATRALFARVDTPGKMLALGEEGLAQYIKTIGLFRQKARNVMKLSRILVEDYGGRVSRRPAPPRGPLAFHSPDSRLCFTADSLMSGGCGRLFEGSPAQMHASLRKLAALPPDTLVCSGHEYTAANLRFAATLEPDNPQLTSHIAEVAARSAKGEPTVPVRLQIELDTNPYLRVHLPALKTAVGLPDADDVTVFAEIRARKDKF